MVDFKTLAEIQEFIADKLNLPKERVQIDINTAVPGDYPNEAKDRISFYIERSYVVSALYRMDKDNNIKKEETKYELEDSRFSQQ